jgi:phospholipid/cholesterol/gamma-HCH transport system ATP-binding protein
MMPAASETPRGAPPTEPAGDRTDLRHDDESAIRLDHVTKAFGGRKVLDDVSFDVPAGSGFVILGRSGTGKSVTLRHMVGLVRPDTGRVWIGDDEISALRGTELSCVRRKIGFLFQTAALFDSISVGENVAFPLRRHTKMKDRDIRARAAEKLAAVGLEREYDQMPAALSGGMRKRVGLARALALDPDVMLYDEPTTGLDPIMSDVINELILRTRARRPVTSIIVTHELQTVRKCAERVVMLSPHARLASGESQILFDGAPDALETAADARVRQFVEGKALERVNEVKVEE